MRGNRQECEEWRKAVNRPIRRLRRDNSKRWNYFSGYELSEESDPLISCFNTSDSSTLKEGRNGGPLLDSRERCISSSGELGLCESRGRGLSELESFDFLTSCKLDLQFVTSGFASSGCRETTCSRVCLFWVME